MIQSFDHFVRFHILVSIKSQEKGLSDVFQSECVFLDKPSTIM